MIEGLVAASADCAAIQRIFESEGLRNDMFEGVAGASLASAVDANHVVGRLRRVPPRGKLVDHTPNVMWAPIYGAL